MLSSPHAPPRVDWITLGVGDLARSKRFYDALGFGASTPHGADLVSYLLEGGQRLALCQRDRLATEAGLGASTSPGSVLLSRNLPSQEAVESMLDALTAAGGTATCPVGTTSWGSVSGWILDPDGHPWEICFNFQESMT